MRTREVFRFGRTLSSTPSISLYSLCCTSVVKVDSIFTDYRIQSNANNQITVALSTEALLSALRSSCSSASSASVAATLMPAYDADELVMKLAKKNDHAVLSFEMFGVSRTGRKVRVTHDVRIDVMRPADVEKLREPLCPEPDVRGRRLRQTESHSCLTRSTSCYRRCRSFERSSRDSVLCRASWLSRRTTAENSNLRSTLTAYVLRLSGSDVQILR